MLNFLQKTDPLTLYRADGSELKLETLTEGELHALAGQVKAEQERRRTLSEAPTLIEQVTARFQAAAGIADGTKFQQPTGAHNVIQPGSTRVFEGELWENTSGVPLSHSPADYPQGWTKRGPAEPVVPDPEDYPEWAAGVDYKIDNVVTYDGSVYRVIQAHTSAETWLPSEVASLYSKVS